MSSCVFKENSEDRVGLEELLSALYGGSILTAVETYILEVPGLNLVPNAGDTKYVSHDFPKSRHLSARILSRLGCHRFQILHNSLFSTGSSFSGVQSEVKQYGSVVQYIALHSFLTLTDCGGEWPTIFTPRPLFTRTNMVHQTGCGFCKAVK